MNDEISKLWPELEWISNEKLRRQTADTWALAFKLSKLNADDLNEIPFTLQIENCPVTFMEHKRAVVHIAFTAAKSMRKFFGDNLPIDLDVVVAGAILADVGKLLEYDRENEKLTCNNCRLKYAIIDDIPNMLIDEAERF